MQHMCESLGLNRAGYYRATSQRGAFGTDDPLESELEAVAGRCRRYGYRRLTKELQAQGWKVNHKRVLALMRKQGLLCRRRPRSIRTTDSRHSWGSYPNLVRGLKVTGLNQLWVADLSYLPLADGFAYLAVILDAYSRRVIGWALEPSLETRLPLGALRMALARRGAPAGLIHHSDRGLQYACRSYTDVLRAHGIRGSMSRLGNPYDNALAESFFKTLKSEEVYGSEYQNVRHVRARMRAYIDIYNRQRLHSALGYRSPVQFEEGLSGGTASPDPRSGGGK